MWATAATTVPLMFASRRTAGVAKVPVPMIVAGVVPLPALTASDGENRRVVATIAAVIVWSCRTDAVVTVAVVLITPGAAVPAVTARTDG